MYFYPRSPCGERHHYGWSWYDDFTISIHALLAESDREPTALRTPHHKFLSTLSLRRATNDSRGAYSLSTYFYPRSPCGERPPPYNLMIHHAKISIHALLAESDLTRVVNSTGTTDFYPRSPCGERRRSWRNRSNHHKFLSTLSLRRATRL